MSRIVQFYHWLLMWFEAKAIETPPDIAALLPPPPENIPHIPQTEPEPTEPEAEHIPALELLGWNKKKTHHHRLKPNDENSWGALYFKEDLLDRLPEYMKHLAQMRRADHDAWSFYRRLGGVMTTRSALFQWHAIDSAWLAFRPSFGLMHISHQAYSDKYDDSRTDATLVYYREMKYPRNIQLQLPPRGMPIYEMSIALHKYGKPVIVECHLTVTRDGEVIPLRYCYEGRWKLPEWIHYFCDPDPNDPDHRRDQEHWNTPRKWIANTFAMVANRTAWTAHGGIQVRATNRDGITASFNIHTERTPYFFADREKQYTETGSTKRIFHIVRTHRRANGALVPVHYRGLRKFTWHDYAVSVTVPGLDHMVLQEARLPATHFNRGDLIPPDSITAAAVAQRIARHMESVLDRHA